MGLSREDVAAAFGSRFGLSGFDLPSKGLPNGQYQLRVFAHDVLTDTFPIARLVDVTVIDPISSPAMAVDAPATGASLGQPFSIAGWAIDRGAASGTGVDAVHVWAYPVAGGSPIFLGAATLGISRPDVGAAFGDQFTPSGYALSASGLAAAQYDIGVHAHSTVTGSFNQQRLVRINVQ
jgi:hypothetical protein